MNFNSLQTSSLLHFARRSLALFACGAVCAASLACVSASKYEELEGQYKTAEEELESARRTISDKESANQKLQEELKAAEAKVAELQQETERLAQEVRSRQQEVQQKQQEISQLQSTKRELSQAAEQAQSRAANQDELQNRIDTLQSEKQALQTQLDELQSELAAAREKQSVQETYNELLSQLRSELEAGSIKIKTANNQITLTADDRIFFESGSAAVSPGGKEILGRFAEALNQFQDKRIYVEGHTDSQPIGPALKDRYPTNWELGAARAISVVRYLAEERDVAADRLSAASFGPFQPVASNATVEGRAQNRRIEITIVQRQAFVGEEEDKDSVDSGDLQDGDGEDDQAGESDGPAGQPEESTLEP